MTIFKSIGGRGIFVGILILGLFVLPGCFNDASPRDVDFGDLGFKVDLSSDGQQAVADYILGDEAALGMLEDNESRFVFLSLSDASSRVWSV